MNQAWKIAPGGHADDWELFRKNGCIGIGWLEDRNFLDFSDKTSILSALEDRYGKNAPGDGKGAATMIWNFVSDVKANDIVVANDAYNRMVGIGIITSKYLPPNSLKNPLRNDDTTHRHHVRLVDWVVTKPADIAGIPPKKYFFVQQTIKELKPEQIDPIVQAYVNTYPDNAAIQQHLKKLFNLTNLPTPESDIVPDVDIHWAASTNGEGRKRLVMHIVRERDRTLVAKKKASVDPPICEVCGFDSRAIYGADYCEVHHLTPLADLDEGTITTLDDLAIVCANCHRIIHLQYPPLSIEELRDRLGGQ